MISVSRLLYPIVEAIIGRSGVWRTGRWLYLGSRRELANDPQTNGEYALQSWVLDAMRQDAAIAGFKPVFLDVGANFGNWTARLLQHLEFIDVHEFLIGAFEPAPVQRGEIERRFQTMIAQKKLFVDSRGVSFEKTTAEFNVTGSDSGSSSLAVAKSDGCASIMIDVTTIDAICEQFDLEHIHIVKVDTEGADFYVIRGAARSLEGERIDVLQFEYNWRWIDFGCWLRDVFSLIEGRPYSVGRLTINGIEFYDAWHPELERYIETNYAIVHHRVIPKIPHQTLKFDLANTPVAMGSGRSKRTSSGLAYSRFFSLGRR